MALSSKLSAAKCSCGPWELGQQDNCLQRVLMHEPSSLAVLQERPEDVPTGELPQSMTLIVDRHLVGKISPGTRVTALGIYSIYQVILLYTCWCQMPSSLLVHLCPS